MRGCALVVFMFLPVIIYSKAPTSSFVTTEGTHFMLDGKPFRFAGTNCYYLSYKDRYMVDDVLESAAQNSFKVIRTWGFIDIGHQDGSGSVDHNYPIKDGHFFQYWDGKAPAYNDSNLNDLDYVIQKAGSLGIKILITFTNNWSDFGGMDQYVQYRKWQDSTFKGNHDDFYVDETIIGWYKAYANHLIQRTNTISGLKYRDDPSIFGWELANEPRCQGSGGGFPSTNNCTINYAKYGKDPIAWKITGWVKHVSTYIKQQDPNHLVSVGDEGFLCERYQQCPDVVCDCYYGIDTINLTKVNGIDFMSLHLYPDQWGKQADWGTEWIANHSRIAHDIGKPVMLGEYGYKNGQHTVYKDWTSSVESSGMNGDLFWMISGQSDQTGDNGWVQNYDGYAVYCNSNSSAPPIPGNADKLSCGILAEHAKNMMTD